MSIYLRTEGLGIRFRHHVGRHEWAAVSGKLGGALKRDGRNRYIQALEGIELDLKEGDRLAIVGNNGSGKTTLLRSLAGIYPPHEGRVEHKGRIASLFNISLGFRQEASGYRNIVLKGLVEGRPPKEIEKAIPGIVDFSGLGPYIDMPLHTYSQGMAMRLAFAIATSFSNDILLMDEWIGVGDAAFREKVVERMNSYIDAAKIVVIASHSSGLLKQIAKQAIWLESGAVRAHGDVSDVIDAYEADVAGAKFQARDARAEKDTATTSGISVNLNDIEGARLEWKINGLAGVHARLLLIRNDGTHKVVGGGGVSGITECMPWLKPGHEFRLIDSAAGVLLASKIIANEDMVKQQS